MRMKKISKAIARCLVPILLLLLMTSVSYANMEVNGVSTVTTQTYNVMLLIDKSGSMNDADNDRLALSAAKQFVDQLCNIYDDLMPVTNVGVMTFDQKTQSIFELSGLDDVKRTLLNLKIDDITYNKRRTGGSDLSVAVYDAAVELKKRKTELSKNIIVMFTDGWSDNVLDSRESEAKLKEAYEIAEELECEIFIVGLNYENSITQEGKNEIYQIADTAQIGEGIEFAAREDSYAKGVKVNYLITDDINEVRKFYGRIYAHVLGGEVEVLDDHKFTVTSKGIREAIVTVYSDSKITGLSILDPDEAEVQEDGKNCCITGDEYYKVIKLLDPDLGTWSLKVRSADQYKTYVIRFYGIEAAINATWGEKEEFGDSGIDEDHIGQVVVTPMYKSELYRDESFPDSLTTAEYTISYEDSSVIYPLTYNIDEGTFEGYFPVETGNYHITATLANDNMNRTAECDLDVNTDDTVYYDLDTIDVKNGKSVDIDLNAFPDISNLDIQSAITDSSVNSSKKENISSVDVNDTVLTINGNKVGEDNLEVHAIDKDGVEYQITGKIKVRFALFWYHFIILALFGVLICIVCWYIRNKIALVRGNFEVFIENTDTEAKFKNADRKVGFENTIGDYPRGKKITLWKLVKDVIDMHKDSTSEQEKELCKMIESEKNSIKSVNLVICNAGNSRGKKKQYTLEGGNRKGLSRKTLCYNSKSSKIRIFVKFVPFMNEFDEENEWGEPIEDISQKHNKIGRKPSGKARNYSNDEKDL